MVISLKTIIVFFTMRASKKMKGIVDLYAKK